MPYPPRGRSAGWSARLARSIRALLVPDGAGTALTELLPPLQRVAFLRLGKFLPREAEKPLGIVLFQPILEKDRLDPVDPSATLAPRG